MLSTHRHQACLLWYQAMGVTDPVGFEPVNRLSLSSPILAPIKATNAPASVQAVAVFDTTTLESLDNSASFNAWLQQSAHNHSLAKTAQQAVLGVGSKNPKIIMLAEAPDRAEDQSGFAWQNPELQWLKQAWQLAAPQMAEHTYYMYLSPWRPPGQRPLTSDELTYCQSLLYKQLQWLNPNFIVSLGPIATRSLTNTTIKNNLKQWLDENNLPYTNQIKLAPLPNAQNMLMSPLSKKATWQQLLSLANQL